MPDISYLSQLNNMVFSFPVGTRVTWRESTKPFYFDTSEYNTYNESRDYVLQTLKRNCGKSYRNSSIMVRLSDIGTVGKLTLTEYLKKQNVNIVAPNSLLGGYNTGDIVEFTDEFLKSSSGLNYESYGATKFRVVGAAQRITPGTWHGARAMFNERLSQPFALRLSMSVNRVDSFTILPENVRSVSNA